MSLNLVRSCALALLVCLPFLTGCRTYGEYGNVELTKEQMRIAVETFADDLILARSNLRQLQDVANERADVIPFAEQYERIVALHTLLLADQQESVEEAANSGDYRTVHRLYGAIIAEQSATAKRYRDLLEGPRATIDTTLTLAGHRVPQGRYAFFPPFYQRIQSRVGTEAPDLQDSTYLLQRSAMIDSLGIPRGTPGAYTHITIQDATEEPAH